MPENDLLDLSATDVSTAKWEDLVQVMMQDELDATALAGCALICGCSCAACGCNCAACGCAC
jgi:hypothetical protein